MRGRVVLCLPNTEHSWQLLGRVENSLELQVSELCWSAEAPLQLWWLNKKNGKRIRTGNTDRKKAESVNTRKKCSTLVSHGADAVDAMVRCHCTPQMSTHLQSWRYQEASRTQHNSCTLPDSSWAKSVKSKMSTAFNLTRSCRKCTPIGAHRFTQHSF